VAAFAPDGNLLHATPEGRARLGEATSLTALGAERLGQHAVSLGRTSGEISGHRVTVERLGSDAGTVLVTTFADVVAAPAPTPEPEPVAPPSVSAVPPPPPVAAEPPNRPIEPPPQE